uniref:ATP synthase F0 subunit 8 n=1 Tax=Amblythyreus gestroi TaxID=2126070 RepID=A0A343W8M7_9HEMI|nr:ATP synthase F0 subunit 8 [Amblythyreus gestroi]AVZ00717.1 ATP synthase F0 subunit 8 [Amblythyreus gestroi]
MPQMAPLWWSTLFMMFIMSMIMLSVTMYFLPKKESGSMMNLSIEAKNMKMMW